MAVSLFGGRRPLRPILGTQAQSQVMVEVRSEDELRRALTPKSTGTETNAKRIVISAPITLKSAIEISSLMAGVVIESNGRFPIYPHAGSFSAFVCYAPRVMFDGLLILQNLVAPDALTSAAFFQDAFALYVDDVDNPPVDVVINRCIVQSTHLFRDLTNGAATGVKIFQCKHTPNTYSDGPSDDESIFFDSLNCSVSLCDLTPDGTGEAVLIGSTGGKTAIVGNCMHGAPITTAASTGLNTISANTNVGVVTAHATDDALGGNT